MSISKKDLYFQYVIRLTGITEGLGIKISDVSVDVHNVVDATKIEFVTWCDDKDNTKWDMMLDSAKSCAEMRLNDAGYNTNILKHFEIDKTNNAELLDKITYFLQGGYVDLTINDDGFLYDVNPDYYIIIDGDVTVDGKHTIISSFRLKDGNITVYDIYNEIHEIVGDVDIFNVAKILA
jgi:hypothetical protein